MREFRDADWPHGLRRGQCDRQFHDGMPYAEQFAGFIDDTPCIVVVCVPCGLEHPVHADV